MNANSPIGVFDSGVGGLTVYRRLRELMPNEHYVYFGDSARNPYGTRPESVVRDFVDQILAFMAANDVKLAIAACNSITVLGLDSLRKDHAFPLLGVSTAAKPALAATRNRRIGVIATQMTCNSGYHRRSILALDPAAEVVYAPAPRFTPLIEAQRFGDPELEDAVAEHTAPLRDAGVDVVTLSCTHYPMIQDLIERHMGPGVTVIDPSLETAQNAQDLLREAGMLNPGSAPGTSRICLSAGIERIRSYFDHMGISGDVQTELVDVSS